VGRQRSGTSWATCLRRDLTIPVAILALASVPATAQDATDVTRAELDAVYEILGTSIDKQVKIVDVGGTNVGVGVLERFATTSDGGAISGLVHDDVTEIYYVLEGSGVLVTGGATTEVREFPADSAVVRELVGPSRGVTAEGGRSREIGPGDVVVIPAGTFHAFSRIDDRIRYLSFRVDPHQVLPAGYVHPILHP